MRAAAVLLSGLTAYLAAAAACGGLPRVRLRPVRLRPASDRRLWLAQAGSDLTPLQFAAGSLAVGAAVFAAALTVSGAWWLAAVPALAAAWFPRAYYSRRRRERLREVREAWPDALRDLTAAVSSGATLVNGLAELAEQGPEPLRARFARFGTLSRMMGAAAALEVVKEELGDPISDRVMEVLILAHHHGGGLIGSVLRDLAAEITEDLRLEAEVRADGAEQRMESRVVALVPWAILLFVSASSGQYQAFYRTGTGFLVAAGGAAWSLAGWLIVRRLARPQSERRVLAGPSPAGAEGGRT